MEVLKLKLNFDSLRISDKGSIAGGVWVELGEKSFPEQNWSDIPTAVTSAFLGAAVRLKYAPGGAKEEVWFLDGPYYVAFERAHGSRWLVSLHNFDGVLYGEAEVNGSASFASIRAGGSCARIRVCCQVMAASRCTDSQWVAECLGVKPVTARRLRPSWAPPRA